MVSIPHFALLSRASAGMRRTLGFEVASPGRVAAVYFLGEGFFGAAGLFHASGRTICFAASSFSNSAG